MSRTDDLQSDSPLAPRNLGTETAMAGQATEIPPTPSMDDEQTEVPASIASTSTATSYNTTVSVGDTEEPTLEHILREVCNITKFPELVSYLALKDLASPLDFAVAEQEDFHKMLPDFGRVVVWRLIILSCYANAYDRFPPIDSTINQAKRSLIETHDWNEFTEMPPPPAPTAGGHPSDSRDTLPILHTRGGYRHSQGS